MYPIMQKFEKQGQPSSLGRTSSRGLTMSENGAVYYNYCFLGKVFESSFGIHRSNYEELLGRLPKEQQNEFQAYTRNFFTKLPQVRRAIKADGLVKSPNGTGCPERPISSKPTEFYNVEIEAGDLDKWKSELTCGKLVCVGSSKPSARDLRMAENIHLLFQAFPEQSNAIVLVGKRHIPRLYELMQNWPEKKKHYLKRP